jgi:molybdopterin-guanine dinucleotide biosynthesis protein A
MIRTMASFAAVVLAGGRGTRMGGADKAAVEYRGRTLLAHALDAVADAGEVVVVGDPVRVAGPVPVRFVRESPVHGGPGAALLAGRDALRSEPGLLAFLAVDMPHVTTATLDRLRRAAAGRDGALLTGRGGRRQLAGVLDVRRLDAVRPPRGTEAGLPVHRLLAALDLAEVPPLGAAGDREGRDVDTWTDLCDLDDTPDG